MGERSDLPKIKPDKAPSMFNGEAAGWGMVGGITGSIVGNLVGKGSRTYLASILIGDAAGFLFGGLKGKAKQEKEQQEGRIVKTPGYWNRGIINGWFAGSLVATPLLVTGVLSSPAAIFAAALGEVGAMVAGSVIRKNGLQHDFDQAVALRDSNQAKKDEMLQSALKEKGFGQEQPISYKNSVTAAESVALAEKQEQKSQSHVAAHQALQTETQHQEATRA